MGIIMRNHPFMRRKNDDFLIKHFTVLSVIFLFSLLAWVSFRCSILASKILHDQGVILKEPLSIHLITYLNYITIADIIIASVTLIILVIVEKKLRKSLSNYVEEKRVKERKIDLEDDDDIKDLFLRSTTLIDRGLEGRIDQ